MAESLRAREPDNMDRTDRTETYDVPHPGFFLKEELEARGWSQRDLAFILGVQEQSVGIIIAERRGISPEMAKALGNAFDVDPDFFANLQKAYDMARAREPDPAISRRARLQGSYPVREMIKRGWLEDMDASMLEAQMMRFFDVDSFEHIPNIAAAAKRSNADSEYEPNQLAWFHRVKQIAQSISVPRYSERALRDALVRLRALMIEPEEARHVPRVLMECGVRFVMVEGLPNGKIDGVCFWLNSSPVIGMSVRLDRIDNFWFVLRHEIEHVLQKHGHNKPVMDVDVMATAENSDIIPEQERVANSAAQEFCVPQSEMESFIARKNPFFSERDIVGFARRMQVHPGIVIGQIQNKTKRWELLRKYLVKIRQFVLPGAIVDGWGHVAPVSL